MKDLQQQYDAGVWRIEVSPTNMLVLTTSTGAVRVVVTRPEIMLAPTCVDRVSPLLVARIHAILASLYVAHCAAVRTAALACTKLITSGDCMISNGREIHGVVNGTAFPAPQTSSMIVVTLVRHRPSRILLQVRQITKRGDLQAAANLLTAGCLGATTLE